jgi:hypothetical protein
VRTLRRHDRSGLTTAGRAAAAVFRDPVAAAAVRAAVAVVSDKGVASALPFLSSPLRDGPRYHREPEVTALLRSRARSSAAPLAEAAVGDSRQAHAAAEQAPRIA